MYKNKQNAMEKISILMDKYIKGVSVQSAFKAYLGGFVCEDEEVVEIDFLEELQAFLIEHPEFENAVTLN